MDDRPREKLLQKGKISLSDAELMAILIGSGTRNESAVDLCRRILASSEHNLNEIGKLSIPQLMKFKGIGQAKAITIIAALELGRRRRNEDLRKHQRGGNCFQPDQRSRGFPPNPGSLSLYLIAPARAVVRRSGQKPHFPKPAFRRKASFLRGRQRPRSRK